MTETNVEANIRFASTLVLLIGLVSVYRQLWLHSNHFLEFVFCSDCCQCLYQTFYILSRNDDTLKMTFEFWIFYDIKETKLIHLGDIKRDELIIKNYMLIYLMFKFFCPDF